ncbi:MAG: hypothetical protein ABL908_16850, partial [Hyphomicrobium sp.]
VIKDGVSGYLVERSESEDDMAERLAVAFATMRAKMRSGEVTPEIVSNEIRDFTPERQLAICYENHRALQRKKWGAGGAKGVSAAASL